MCGWRALFLFAASTGSTGHRSLNSFFDVSLDKPRLLLVNSFLAHWDNRKEGQQPLVVTEHAQQKPRFRMAQQK